MQQSTTHFGPLPGSRVTAEMLQKMVFEAIVQHGHSFQFGSIKSTVESKLRKTEGAFNIPANTTYTGGLDGGDVARIREIIWDFIILRYLTLGDFHSDGWPYLSATDKGKAFFVR